MFLIKVPWLNRSYFVAMETRIGLNLRLFRRIHTNKNEYNTKEVVRTVIGSGKYNETEQEPYATVSLFF